MHVSLVYNPAARAGTAPGAEELASLIRAAGHQVAACAAGTPAWAAALQDPGDLLVLAGGDGTVAGTLRAIAASGQAPPLATILPVGTANNIAKTLGLARPLAELVRDWPAMRLRSLDVGVVDAGNGARRLFVEAAGLGVLTEMIGELDGEARPLNAAIRRYEGTRGYVGLLGEMLARAPVGRITVVADGHDLTGEYLLVEVLNVGMVGPNLTLAPAADPGDGLLDLLLVDEGARCGMQEWLTARAEGAADGAPLRTLSVREVELAPEPGRELRLRRDDDVGIWRERLSIGVRPGALRLLAP